MQWFIYNCYCGRRNVTDLTPGAVLLCEVISYDSAGTKSQLRILSCHGDHTWGRYVHSFPQRGRVSPSGWRLRSLTFKPHLFWCFRSFPKAQMMTHRDMLSAEDMGKSETAYLGLRNLNIPRQGR